MALAALLGLGASRFSAEWRQKERDPVSIRALAAQKDALTRELQDARQRETAMRGALQRARDEATQRMLDDGDPDAGWLCERFRCVDVQRPLPSNFHEPRLIREVPSDYRRPRP